MRRTPFYKSQVHACVSQSVKMSIPLAIFLVLMSLSGLASSTSGDDSSISDLIQDLHGLGDFQGELNFVSDFASLPSQTRLLKELSEAGIPVYSYDVRSLRQRQLEHFIPEPCPILSGTNSSEPLWYRLPHDKIVIRQEVMPALKKHRLIFVWTKDLDLARDVVEIFDDSVMRCAQKREAGVFNSNTRFYFYSEKFNQALAEMFFDLSVTLRKHPKIAVISHIGPGKFGFWSYNFFHQENGLPRVFLRYIWSHKERLDSIKQAEIFTSLDNFFGKEFAILTLIEGRVLQATYLSEEEISSPYHLLKDHWGSDIDILLMLENHLNFTHDFMNTLGFSYGGIKEDGSWDGLPRMIADTEQVDFTIGSFTIDFNYAQMINPVQFYTRGLMTFMTPPPRPHPKYLTLLEPFQHWLWLAVILCLFATWAMLYAVAVVEEGIMGDQVKFRTWGQGYRCFWACLATFLGESIAATVTVGPRALRFVVGAWTLYSFIVLSAYSGNLKSHLTSHSTYPSLKTLEEVVKSDLRIDFMLYQGGIEEDIVGSSTEPLIQALWKRATFVRRRYDPAWLKKRMDEVCLGNAVMFDWIEGFHCYSLIDCAGADGSPLPHVGNTPISLGSHWQSWGFNKISPWKDKFEEMVSRILESGIRPHLMSKTMTRMIEEAKSRGGAIRRSIGHCNGCPLEFIHMEGSFILLGMLLVTAALVFAGEKAVNSKGPKRGH